MTAQAAPRSGPGLRGVIRRAFPYLLLAPGMLWLAVFYVLPAIQMFTYSISTRLGRDRVHHRPVGPGVYHGASPSSASSSSTRSCTAGSPRSSRLVIGFPVAYTIAFRGGRYKNLILFLVIAPFFTSFLIRTISWKILLGDEGPIFGFLKHGLGILPGTFSILGTPVAQVFGITYNFLPFMILPLYVALEKIDPRLLEAGADLFGSPIAVFRRVTVPLALPGIFAGTLLTFIPAMGDYINAELLGNPNTRMIGNVIQNRLLVQNDYPVGSALSFILMAGILIAVAVYAKLLGTEQLTG